MLASLRLWQWFITQFIILLNIIRLIINFIFKQVEQRNFLEWLVKSLLKVGLLTQKKQQNIYIQNYLLTLAADIFSCTLASSTLGAESNLNFCILFWAKTLWKKPLQNLNVNNIIINHSIFHCEVLFKFLHIFVNKN